jgi:hypothetical protein
MSPLTWGDELFPQQEVAVHRSEQRVDASHGRDATQCDRRAPGFLWDVL